MQAMILTAGKGNRLRPYTEILPKPAIPLLNVPMLCYSLELLRPLGLEKIVGNLHHLPNKMSSCWKSLKLPTQQLYLSDESTEILGGGGGLKKAQGYFDRKSLFLINGDEVLLPKDPLVLQKLWDHHHANGNIATILCIPHEQVGKQFGGVWTNDNLSVVGFGKSPAPGSAKGYHFVGYLVVSYEIFDYIPKNTENNILYDAITLALQKGHRAEAFLTEACWYETGNPDDYLSATETLIRKLGDDPYLQNLLANWTEPFQILKQGRLIAAQSARLPQSFEVNDFAVVGPGAELPEKVVLSRAIIGAGVKIDYPQSVENQLVLA